MIVTGANVSLASLADQRLLIDDLEYVTMLTVRDPQDVDINASKRRWLLYDPYCFFHDINTLGLSSLQLGKRSKAQARERSPSGAIWPSESYHEEVLPKGGDQSVGILFVLDILS